jgi:serine/threonine-protein kinase RsbW/stage II sporulation protein AB (anti-sigma F factor)
VGPDPLHRTIPARAEEIAPLRAAVLEYARHVGVLDPFGVALAVSETVANAVLHAYIESDKPGDIVVHAEADGEFVLTVEDTGRGMRPRPDSPGAGLGLPLVAHFAARFEVCDRPRGGTQVCMAFPTAG